MESLRFRAPPAVLGMPPPPIPAVCFEVRPPNQHHHLPTQVRAAERNAAPGAAAETADAPRHSYMYARDLRRLWAGGGGGVDRGNGGFEAMKDRKERGEEEGESEEQEGETSGVERRRRQNWVMKILRVRSIWSADDGEGEGRGGGEKFPRNEEEKRDQMLHGGDRCVSCCDAEASDGCHSGEDAGQMQFDRDSFTRLLQRVSLVEARLFSQMSYLGRLAYNIPKIKPAYLLEYHRLHFVTSSLEEKSKLPVADKVHASAQGREMQWQEDEENGGKGNRQQKNGRLISPSSAYKIAASAASYLQSQTRSILPFRSVRSEACMISTRGGSGSEDKNFTSSDMASFVATTNSVTAVVAAKEETKQAVAKDLNSAKSSPCEWFICDGDATGTRVFVIQGSESVASWQANLLFEPIQFEGLDVFVHRGIYEAAKGIFQQLLPHVRDHLNSCGNSATFRFTGHSLGGSLSVLVNLMLLIRGEVPPSSLLPVITFGSPYIMCGGDYLLQKLGLPLNHVQALMMHRDIVPRAFSCNYPDHVAEMLKAVNGKFRNHPCLKHQRLLYAPMGQLLILQPEEEFSPHHHLLPAGSGLFVLVHKSPNPNDSMRTLHSAQSMFLNSPHPLEILSDRAAYGPGGTLCRDHDSNAYLRSLRSVVCQELKRIRKARKECRRQMCWPLVSPQGINERFIMSRQTGSKNLGPIRLSVSIVFNGGMESLRKFGRFFASRHGHLLVMLLFPAKILLLGAVRVTNFR